MRSISLLALAVALSPSAAFAQTEPASVGAADSGGATSAEAGPGDHHDHDDVIVVTGVRRKAGDVLGGLTVLDSEELAKDVRTSIGETLARQPGITASSFGPTASRPILRGLSGDRIRILTDGNGSIDI
jgi:iron complex outermembrane receptor protein